MNDHKNKKGRRQGSGVMAAVGGTMRSLARAVGVVAILIVRKSQDMTAMLCIFAVMCALLVGSAVLLLVLRGLARRRR